MSSLSNQFNPNDPQYSLSHFVSDSESNKISILDGAPFFGEEFFMAAGGGTFLGVAGPVYGATAATIQGRKYFGSSGTSFAAPHVAGAYAVVKAGFKKLGIPWRVVDGSDYLRNTASVPTSWMVPGSNPAEVREYRSIRFGAAP